jgi:hypothetical protein
MIAGMLVAALAGCAMPGNETDSAPPTSQEKWWGATEIQSDPPGAHIYYAGRYLGETAENAPIRQVWWYSTHESNATLTLKKRGYKETSYYMIIRHDYPSQAEAERHYQKVVVVMDLE